MAALALAQTQLPVTEAYLPAIEFFNQILGELLTPENQQMQHSQLEDLIDPLGRELMRLLFQGYVDNLGPGPVAAPVVNADGDALTHSRLHGRQLKVIFGPVALSRIGYGGPGLESLHPQDAVLNVPDEHYSHGLRRKAVEQLAVTSYEESQTNIEKQTTVKIPKQQLAELAIRAAADFESFYEARGAAAEAADVSHTGEVLALSFDGKGVPMRHEDLRDRSRLAAETQEPRLAHRRSQGEKGRKRMSAVSAVYTIAPFIRTPEEIAGELRPGPRPLPSARPRPEHKRVRASLEEASSEVMRTAFEDALQRDPDKKKRWCVLVDGDRLQLARVRQQATDFGVTPMIILDLIHVIEYLWTAAWALYAAQDQAAGTWVHEDLLEILRGHSSQVAAGVRRSATLREMSAAERKPLDKCADYLLHHRAYLRYDEYLAAGLPIASGVIEGTCRYLVKDRMEITGARWRLTGAEAILRLRSLRASGDLAEYWEYHLEQEYKRNHASRYAEGVVPMPAPPAKKVKGRHLHLVK